MISSGLFVLPGLAFARAGPAMIVSYALAALLMVPTILSKVELATAMPRAGGTYFYIERSLGALPGTFAGLANWFSIALKSAFALVGIGAFVHLFNPGLGPIQVKLVVVACCVLFTITNLVSVKLAGKAQVLLVMGLLALLIYFGFQGLGAMHHGHFARFVPHEFTSVLSTAGMVFISFGGLTKIASVSEEIRNPRRNIPLAMFLALGIVGTLYVLVAFVVVGVSDPKLLPDSQTPISLAAEQFMGPVGWVLMAVAAMLAFITTANSGIMSASRSPMAMSRDGLMPDWFRRINKRFQTPHNAIFITSGFMIVVIIFLSLEELVKTASAMMLILFILDNVAVVIMRKSNIPNYRPTIKAPLCPWLQIAAVIVYVFLILEMGAMPLLITGLFALGASVWFLFYINPRVVRESAFVYMVKSIVSPAIRRTGLEEELKQIALERDEVVQDRFDQLVQDCEVLDLEGEIPAKELFRQTAKVLAPRLGIDEDTLYQKFLDRERDSSTVILPGLGIPHVIVEGKNLFEIMLIRCRPGVIFSELNPPVTTMFVLVGSRDERNYHLRALVAIAHICQEKDFKDRWQAARNPEQLRDIVLLSSRQRED